jgi:hypothetical protein
MPLKLRRSQQFGADYFQPVLQQVTAALVFFALQMFDATPSNAAVQ